MTDSSELDQIITDICSGSDCSKNNLCEFCVKDRERLLALIARERQRERQKAVDSILTIMEWLLEGSPKERTEKIVKYKSWLIAKSKNYNKGEAMNFDPPSEPPDYGPDSIPSEPTYEPDDNPFIF